MTIQIQAGDFTVLPLAESDRAALERLCRRSAEFFNLVGDELASETAAAEILGPLAAPYAQGTKHVFGTFAAGELTAVTELLQGYPASRDWYIGLLLVDPDQRRKGIGRQLASAIVDWIAQNGGAAVRLVVQQQNQAAAAFWKQLGFQVEIETVSAVGQRSSVSWVLVRSLPAG